MKAYDPKGIRPRRDWCIVLAEPRKSYISAGTRPDGKEARIILTEEETGIEKVTEGVGRIIRIGPGRKNDAMGLRVGMRVAYRSYLKFANHITAREHWSKLDPDFERIYGNSDISLVKEHFFISADDLICEVEEDVDLGVFSSAANIAHTQKREKKLIVTK